METKKRDAALAVAQYMEGRAKKEVDASMSHHWESLADAARALASGEYTEDEGLPFVVSRGLANVDAELALLFLEAWGYDIGGFGSALYNLADTIKQALNDSNKR